VDERFQPGTRSWTELSFGQTSATHESTIPWDPATDVIVPGTDLLLSGRIDRIDLTATADAIRISDYKSGKIPKNADRIVVAQGTEVQRVLYAIAARHLLPNVRTVISRLVFLDGASAPLNLRGDTLDDAITTISRFLKVASTQIRDGQACPGPDARDRFNDMRLALPADLDSYFSIKSGAFEEANHELSPLWRHA
jgi:hypothetical protein